MMAFVATQITHTQRFNVWSLSFWGQRLFRIARIHDLFGGRLYKV